MKIGVLLGGDGMRDAFEGDFRRKAEKGDFVFDKTASIRRIFEDGRYVSLITRPHGFGKTFTQTMLRAFFERKGQGQGNEADTRRLFRDTAILMDVSFCEKHLAQWPVLFLPFSRVKGRTFDEAMTAMVSVLADCATPLGYLQDSSVLSERLKAEVGELLHLKSLSAQRQDAVVKKAVCTLAWALWKHFGHWVMVLWDDYDVPLAEAEVNGYYPQMQSVLREMFSRGIKDSEAVGKAVLTGSSVAAEGFDDNVGDFSCSMLEQPYLWNAVGFTSVETKAILKRFGREDCWKTITENGTALCFGDEKVYPAREVLSLCSDIGR